MGAEPTTNPRSESVYGVIYAGLAFLIWGLSPVYWKALGSVPAMEIIMHRVVWSFLFLLPLIVLQRKWDEFVGVLKNYRILLILLMTAIFVGGNWFLYVWAVNHEFLLQGSLGYYINPLVNVVLGMIFLRERLRKPQLVAVLLAASGVVYLTLYYGEFPWIALTLALSFGFYGLIRKIAPVGSLVGLTIETMLLTLPAGIYLIYLDFQGSGSIFRVSYALDFLLIGCAPLTAVPLLLFTLGAKRINLSTLGLMQYIGPSGMFLLAVVFYGEPFSSAQVWTFVLIWTALAIYSTDSVIYFRRDSKRLTM
ncbi:MAG: EamA family transporter RarD [Desulfobacterales bacterium]|jgi:chloramphenicol-sensitive protein RarD